MSKVRIEIIVIPATKAFLLPLKSTNVPTGRALKPSTAGYRAMMIPAREEFVRGMLR